ncbi:MAG: DUF4124 domain-containing protein [Thiogranum sp.]
MKSGGNPVVVSRGIVLLLLFSATANGAEIIYKWAGPDGVTHYAGEPPESALAGFEVLEVVAASPAPAAAANYRSVLDVASSIEASRLARERSRLEREKLLLQERRLAAQQQNYAADAGGVYYLPYYRYHRPHRPRPPNQGNRPVPTPYNNGGQPQRRVYLNR